MGTPKKGSASSKGQTTSGGEQEVRGRLRQGRSESSLRVLVELELKRAKLARGWIAGQIAYRPERSRVVRGIAFEGATWGVAHSRIARRGDAMPAGGLTDRLGGTAFVTRACGPLMPFFGAIFARTGAVHEGAYMRMPVGVI